VYVFAYWFQGALAITIHDAKVTPFAVYPGEIANFLQTISLPTQ
jgi:hypothetical protein